MRLGVIRGIVDVSANKRLSLMTEQDWMEDDDLEVLNSLAQHYLVLLKDVFTSARLLPDLGEFIATKSYPEIDIIQGEVLYTFGGFLTPSISSVPLLAKAFNVLNSIRRSAPSTPKLDRQIESRLISLVTSYSCDVVNFARDFSAKNSAKATCEELKRRFGVNVTVFKVREWRREARRIQVNGVNGR